MPTAAMRHLHAIAHATIALMLLGCTQEEQNDLPATTGEPVVTFLAAANDPTRGTAMSGSFNTDATFRVYATQQLRNGSSVADGSTPTVFIPGDIVSYQQVPAYGISHNLWVWKTATDYLWPQDNYFVNFYAIYPATAPMMTDFPADKSFSYADGDGNQLIDGNTDLMYAYVQTHRDDSEFTSVTPNVGDNSTVHLQFHHLLSLVAFYGKLSPQFQTWGWTVEVDGITIHNVNAAGTYDFGSATAPTLTLAGPSVARAYNMHMASTDGITVNSTTDAVALTSTSDVTMLLPQNPTAWKPAEQPISSTTDCYLSVRLRITDRDGYYHIGTAESYGTVYVPFSTGVKNALGKEISWLSDKIYKYTLIFGGGYDAAGKAVLQPMTIETAIKPWEASTVDGEAKHQRSAN